MDYQLAQNHIHKLSSGLPIHVSFVTPIVSVCLAAAKVAGMIGENSSITFGNEATGYAENNGLRYYIGLSSNIPVSGQSVGRSYCQISKLYHHSEVDSCNANLGSLLHTQLSRCPNKNLVAAACGVIGELHDNIASHAKGCGFSAAQFYTGNRSKLQIALADCGQGFFGSVRRFGLQLGDSEAISWCLKRGNTTCPPCAADPFGPQLGLETGEEADRSGSHHMGEGLYRLVELVRQTGGLLWIWSGNGVHKYNRTEGISYEDKLRWSGTAIEIELPISAFESCAVATDAASYESLAKRLGL